MWTRRDFLGMTPAAALLAVGRAADAADDSHIDTHMHIHRDAPALQLGSHRSVEDHHITRGARSEHGIEGRGHRRQPR